MEGLGMTDAIRQMIIKSKEDLIDFSVFILRVSNVDLVQSEEYSIEIDEEDDVFYYDSTKILLDLLDRILQCTGHPIRVFYIPFYDDRYFRSSYSLYYFSKHFQKNDTCGRIFLFDDVTICEAGEAPSDIIAPETFERAFIGSIVKRPIPGMEIGRTLIDPRYLFGNVQSHQIRTTKYAETMYGIRLHVYAFPYTMQDGETMTCAETTILNIADYFSARYQTYHAVYPDDVSALSLSNSYERNIPSRGLSYRNISRILKEIGFFPRLYAAKFTKERFLAILHSYIISGIPVAMGIDKGVVSDVGHSVVAIGVERDFCNSECFSLDEVFVECVPNLEAKSLSYIALIGGRENKYILMDDGKSPYVHAQISVDNRWLANGDTWRVMLNYGANPYNITSLNETIRIGMDEEHRFAEKYNVSFLTAPLSREMAMDAEDAIRCFKNILTSTGKQFENAIGYISYACNKEINSQWDENDKQLLCVGNSEDNPLLLRIFMCAARSLKKQRILCLEETERERLNVYRCLHMPRFVWVCELFSLASIRSNPASCIGEIILDATSANTHASDLANVILIDYPGKLAYRNPNEGESSLLYRYREATEWDQWQLLTPFEYEDRPKEEPK